jgi:hypothetical protein
MTRLLAYVILLLPLVTFPADAGKSASPSGVTVITDEDGSQIQIEPGKNGDPKVIGCADGQREALTDLKKYPNIAGCLGLWKGTKSLRDKPTGHVCGNDKGECAVPADLCASGWHICSVDGTIAEVRQLSAEACANAGGGRYSAAISHCLTQEGCECDVSDKANYPCFAEGWCSEPVCCGKNCGDFGSCTGGVWPEATHIAQGTDQGCAATTSRRAGGVLCCKDGVIAPAPPRKAVSPGPKPQAEPE